MKRFLILSLVVTCVAWSMLALSEWAVELGERLPVATMADLEGR